MTDTKMFIYNKIGYICFKKRRGEKRNKLYYFKAAILKWYEGKKVTFIFRDIFRTFSNVHDEDFL